MYVCIHVYMYTYIFTYKEAVTKVMCVVSIKVPIRKKSGNLFNEPYIYIYIYIYI